jgi:hypothetical protein
VTVKRSSEETADRSPHRGLARIGQRRDDGPSCIRLHRPSLHDFNLPVLHIELFNSDLLLRSSHLRSVEVAQQEVPQRVQDEDSPPPQVPKSQTASALLANGFDFTEKIAGEATCGRNVPSGPPGRMSRVMRLCRCWVSGRDAAALSGSCDRSYEPDDSS